MTRPNGRKHGDYVHISHRDIVVVLHPSATVFNTRSILEKMLYYSRDFTFLFRANHIML